VKAICKYTLILLSAALIVLVTAPGTARADEPLVITGTGLKQDVIFNESYYQFYHPKIEELYYSSNNNWNFKSIWRVKGFRLRSLLDQFGAGNLKEGVWPITFKAKDGLSFTMTLQELENRFYYPDLTIDSEEQVDPMIGIYRAQLFNVINPTPPIKWTNRPLTEADRDKEAPRLYFGQKKGNIDDRNQPFFIRDLVLIVVGEERPPGSSEPANPPVSPNSPGTPPDPGAETPADAPPEPGSESAETPQGGFPLFPFKPADSEAGAGTNAPQGYQGRTNGFFFSPAKKAQPEDSAVSVEPGARRPWGLWIAAAVVAAGALAAGFYYFYWKEGE